MGYSFLLFAKFAWYLMKEVIFLNRKSVNLIGFGIMALGFLATALGNWYQEKQVQEMVKEEVQKQLSEGEESE